jgi:hypothetical protein
LRKEIKNFEKFVISSLVANDALAFVKEFEFFCCRRFITLDDFGLFLWRCLDWWLGIVMRGRRGWSTPLWGFFSRDSLKLSVRVVWQKLFKFFEQIWGARKQLLYLTIYLEN